MQGNNSTIAPPGANTGTSTYINKYAPFQILLYYSTQGNNIDRDG
jgi:hypothetical protein